MTTAIIYARFSPRPNAEDSISIEAQYGQCVVWCRDRFYDIGSKFSDEGMSGGNTQRPGLHQAIAALCRGYILVTYSPDRIARDVAYYGAVCREVKQAHAIIEYADGTRFEATPEGRMLENITASVAQFNREKNAQRTSDSMKQHQKNGRRMSDRTPFGMERNPNNRALMIENPEEQKLIEEIIEMHKLGLGYRKICQFFTKQGILFRGGRWYETTVSRILKREYK